MSKASAAEQYMLELINAERAKVGAQPLAFNGDLNESSENHSSWMLSNNTLSHYPGGLSPRDRMESAGYDFSGLGWNGWNESIAFQNFLGTVNQDVVQKLHTHLMNSPGDRANLLNTEFREIGVGIETGQFDIRFGGGTTMMVTQDFVSTPSTASDFFLTGVAFRDEDNDNRYDIGEGFDNVTVSAKNNATGEIVTTTTNVGGGYDLQLANGTYTVIFYGSEVSTSVLQANINSKNVKLDLVNPNIAPNQASAAEQFMLELINTKRVEVGAQPLVFNNALNEITEDHSNWVLETDTFSIRGADGLTSIDHAVAAGHVSVAEGVFSKLNSITPDVVEWMMNDYSSRPTLLKDTYSEIGVGVETGKYQGHDTTVMTQVIGHNPASDSFLTGVVYSDQDGDHRYDIGEGFDNVTVSAKNNATGAIVTTTTNVGGGYDLELANGTYTVSFSGSEFATTALQANINSQNVKLDLVDPELELQLNTITGNSLGNVFGGTAGDDELLGLDGSDMLFGFDGNDHINGGNDSDWIFGGAGADILTGGTGVDLFIFDTPFDNTFDKIVDFSVGEDYIGLVSSIFPGLNTGILDASAFYIGAEAHDANDYIIYNSETGALYFDADAVGGADAVQFAELTPGMSYGDITISTY